MPFGKKIYIDIDRAMPFPEWLEVLVAASLWEVPMRSDKAPVVLTK